MTSLQHWAPRDCSCRQWRLWFPKNWAVVKRDEAAGTVYSQPLSSRQLCPWLVPDQNGAKKPTTLPQRCNVEGLSDRSLPGKPSTCARKAPAVSRSCFLLSNAEPFWRIEAGMAFVFSGLRSGWASGHRFPSRNFLRGEIS